MKILIEKKNGRWLVNGKHYTEALQEEKEFFNQFIASMNWDYKLLNSKNRSQSC